MKNELLSRILNRRKMMIGAGQKEFKLYPPEGRLKKFSIKAFSGL